MSDTKAALKFLKTWAPNGPWVLTSIVPDDLKTSTMTFTPENEAGMAQWIDVRQGMANMYFHVNKVSRELVKKASKEDIESVPWLHVDCDPSGNNPEENENHRRQILKRLEEYRPTPNVIIDSGGGYQAFWRLTESFMVKGDRAKAAEIEAYNKQLEIELDGDNCHNVDRIMRLPGTTNMPNKKKRSKGREPRDASLVTFNTDVSYELDIFTAAAQVQGSGGRDGGRIEVEISGNLPQINEMEDLERVCADGQLMKPKLKGVIVQGLDPADPTHFASRSEATWYVVCNMVKCGIPDEWIAATLLDPDLGISAHTLDQKRPEQYAVRQIQRAKENAVEPALATLNDKYFVSHLGGKVKVWNEEYDANLRRSKLAGMHPTDFINLYKHRKVTIETVSAKGNATTKEVDMGKWWFEHPNRRTYMGGIRFLPGNENPDDIYNRWQGFNYESKPGDKHLSYLYHIEKVICGGEKHLYDYLINWMARSVQHPDKPAEVAIVMRGARGVGKTQFAKTFGALFGRHYLPVSDPKHLVGSFNAHLADCLVLFGDEAFFAGDKKHESILKTLITEETKNVERKGFDMELQANQLHIIIASNDLWVIPAGSDERRFFVVDVVDAHKQDHKYFSKLNLDLLSGGYENLLYFLQTKDISKFNIRKVPMTKALLEQKQFSQTPEEKWWYEKLENGTIHPTQDYWDDPVQTDYVYTDYTTLLMKLGVLRKHTPTRLGRDIATMVGPAGEIDRRQKTVDVDFQDELGDWHTKRGRKWFYALPSLEECRRCFDLYYGGPYDWPEIVPYEPEVEQEEAPF
jgi:hypothetical protein